jgi:predicted SAM-dependent methyltransferase
VIKKPIVKIELGSGSKKGKSGWITIDLCGADINMDSRRRLPILIFSVDEFFASYFLEHLNIMELHNILATYFQQIKIGGQFYIAVSYGSLFINAYNKIEI